MHHYTLHRSPAHFAPLPEVFWPERWLTQDTYMLPSGETIGHDQVTTDRATFMPFSIGSQNCAGKALAVVELRAVVCALVQRFEAIEIAERVDLDSWEANVMDVYVSMRGRLRVSLKTPS